MEEQLLLRWLATMPPGAGTLQGTQGTERQLLRMKEYSGGPALTSKPTVLLKFGESLMMMMMTTMTATAITVVGRQKPGAPESREVAFWGANLLPCLPAL